MNNKAMITVALLVVVLVGLPLACKPMGENSGQSATGKSAPAAGKVADNADKAGVYILVTVDGHTVPYSPHQDSQPATKWGQSPFILGLSAPFPFSPALGPADGQWAHSPSQHRLKFTQKSVVCQGTPGLRPHPQQTQGLLILRLHQHLLPCPDAHLPLPGC